MYDCRILRNTDEGVVENNFIKINLIQRVYLPVVLSTANRF